ncbi:Histidine kinase-, DNA gyrase B-, and HSP90-like ATPase [Colwellia chukchiensis]|uniref:Histidine kinase-, DNA gyrase B-, and HSP90-like ATPase n=1 Tax=Colwellia chukchiensis TaxID=641665 RepID=A0A1H7Q8U2_9GAMM|nr:histidine kinase [Colwellia chukchiensis]SEL44510.1 Histidine kinase-, DNA gyrase B-, and HSP90-like ATPase [Colwellia chukchiensis]
MAVKPYESTLEIEPQAFSKQSHQFWTLQITGWLGYAVVVFLAIIRPQIGQTGFNLSGQLLNLILETFSGFVLSYLQWQLIRKIVHLPLKKTLLLSFLSAASLGLVFNVIKLSTYKMVVYQQQWNEAWDMLEFGGWLLFSLSTMFVWTSIYFIMLYNTKLQGEHEMLLRAQTAAKDAQLQMLRYQLNPHFMFNTMNAISTLIYKNDNDTANEMLDKLCEFFRYSLDKNDKSKTTLQKELELIELYLSIEKVRFGERLKVEIAVNSEVLACQVPSMLLQPLVENAIKHAIELRKSGGEIRISAQQVAERLLIEVADNGQQQSAPASDGFGIGLTNTKARLSAMFAGNYHVNIANAEQGGTVVSISIPFEQ